MSEMETVEQFLARGGKVNSLPMGYTAYPDGNIPMAPKPRKTKIVETPAAVILEKNKEIRKLSSRKKRGPATVMSAEQLANITKEQMQVLDEFCGKMFHGDKKRFCKLCGIAPKTLDNARAGNGRIGFDRWQGMKKIIESFEFSTPKPKVKARYKPRVKTDEYARRDKVIEARKIAEQNGDTVFMAPCRHHGMTKFYLHGKQPPRCTECRLALTKRHLELHKDAEQKCKDDRAKLNKERMLNAIDEGKNSFTGLCVRCGYTEMKYSVSPGKATGYSYRCITCTRAAQLKYKAKNQ